MKAVLFFFALLLVAGCFAKTKLHRKQLAGPPTEFEDMRLPSTTQGAQTNDAAQFEIDLQASANGGLSYTANLPVDSAVAFAFSVLTPLAEYLDISLTDPTGSAIDLESIAFPGYFPLGDFKSEIPETSYSFETPIVGLWTLTMTTKSGVTVANTPALAAAADTEIDGYVILWNDIELQVYTKSLTYSTVQGALIGLQTHIFDGKAPENKNFRKLGLVPTPLTQKIAVAALELELPNGIWETIPMHDDGQHFDGEADDGIFGAAVTADQIGVYAAEAFIVGAEKGAQFIRSTEHLFNVVPDVISLVGTATGMINKADKRMTIDLAVDFEDDKSFENLFRAYAEVYGLDAAGNEVAVAWISSIVDAKEKDGQHFVPLELDLNWLVKAGANAPLTLKNIVLQNQNIPVATLESILVSIPTGEVLTSLLKSMPQVVEITEAMSFGIRPAHLGVNATQDNPKLILVHGYCSAANPWAEKSVFTDAEYFLNPSASITNDAFAKMVVDFAERKGIDSFSLIGHSQGGMVCAHIHNYYWTALENPLYPSGRKIQSVGTPYGGTSIAGSSANLGKSFGVGCGANYDLTHDGAALWMSGISAAARKDVYYYTTQYQTGGLVNYCNLAVNLLLEWPNDGTTEYDWSQLSGANNLGHLKGWCHTDDMASEPQYWDLSRNKDMNSKAAR